MFGLPSISKLMVLAIVLLVVWNGFKWINQLDKSRKDGGRKAARGPRNEDRSSEPRGGDIEGIETMACPECGTYFPASVGRYCGGSRCKA